MSCCSMIVRPHQLGFVGRLHPHNLLSRTSSSSSSSSRRGVVDFLTPPPPRHHAFVVPSSIHSSPRRRFYHASLSLSDKEERHIQLTTLTNPDIAPGATIALLTLNRPPANAMGRCMLTQLEDSLAEIEQQFQPVSTTNEATTAVSSSSSSAPPPRCLVLCSALAPKVFSAGADLKERATMTVDQAAAFVTRLRRTMHRVACLPIPVLAAIDGVAVGGGLELALAADVRVASAKSLLGLPETSLAIVPGAGGTQRLPRLIGAARAKELVFTGMRLNGLQAYEYGLVQHVVVVAATAATDDDDDDDNNGEKMTALDKTLEIAWKIAKNGPVAIRAAKWAMDNGMEAETMESALEIERQGYEQVLKTQDRLEGLAAFKEGRSPEYKGI